MEYHAILAEAAERAGVSPDDAETLTRASFDVLADRIRGGEAQDLAQPLPEPLKSWLRTDEEIAKGYGLRATGYGANSFVRRVSRRADVPREPAEVGILVLSATVREAVGDQEPRDGTAQLPRECDILLCTPAGPAGEG
ncbi:DUF2267 domain-containing protein [Streptomyces sp. I5]|uniref:DUF2267 domain-containing protein n=1 Tax=Streptomyces sp. I5 TaxID=2759947 RepID=UPI0018EE9101|nr:DUF2267 domain-containing protein [Streptomyces sp. I5]MBJ6630367.1 DUF2267 domain-containing protein [Streptomyces sp. I5]